MQFDDAGLLAKLDVLDPLSLDQLPFGVIGFGADCNVCLYNAPESRASGLAPEEVLGRPLFTEVAQCMNNFMVAQRFEDAATARSPLDATIDYLLTWRMRPTKVRLRMLCAPGIDTRYVLLQRLS